MGYDFTSVPDRRNWGSSKWNAMPNASPEKVPLSVADMEFVTAPEIVEALKELAENAVLGYTRPTQAYFDAVCGWMQRRHSFTVTPEQIITTPGVVGALGLMVEALTKPEDAVLILSPVYYPFEMAAEAKGRKVVRSSLCLDGDRYSIDFDDLQKQTSREDVKLLIFCSPHNPIGRVWSKEELEQVMEICLQNGVFVISDEIHNDLILPGNKHTVMATLSEEAAQNCAVCTAPSKTFNLAGLQCSNIIIQNLEVCEKVRAQQQKELAFSLNIFAYTACRAAYDCCEDWLEELLTVIDGNAKYVRDFMAEHFPDIKVFPLEGTYLLWLDCRCLGLDHEELERRMQHADLWLDEGYIFGTEGRGFERINLACARITLERAMERFLKEFG